MYRISQKVFSNKLRLVVVPDSKNPSVMCAVLVSAGSSYETKKQNGISHFLEHLCFKGTKKRPHAIDISSELEGLGAHYNAFTERELTGYHAKVAAQHREEIAEIVADLYLHPIIDQKELEKEKGVIIEEINMYEDQPRAKVEQIFEKALYGDQHAGRDIAGPKENILAMTKNDIHAYRDKYYHAAATTIVMTGNITPDQAEKEVKKLFRELPRGKRVLMQKIVKNKQQKIAVVHRALDQAHIIVGAKAMTTNDSSQFAGMLMVDILGGGMSSRLFQTIREKLGMAYYIRSSLDIWGTHGHVTISGGLSNDRLGQGLAEIRKQIQLLVRDGITEKELSRAKNHRIGSLLLSLETPSSLGFWYAGQMAAMGKVYTPQQVVKQLRAVTVRDVNRLSKQLLTPDRWSLAVVGPHKDTKKIEKALWG